MDNIRYSNETQFTDPDMKNKRGITVYSMSDLQQVTGRDKEGRLLQWGVETPYFYLTIQQREEIFRLSSPVFGLISSRMNRMAGLQFNITSEKYKEDEIAEEMKDLKSYYEEMKGSLEMRDIMLKAQIVQKLRERMPDLNQDLSNFDGALLRWKRKIKRTEQAVCDNAYEWLQQPNQGVLWEDFVKEWTHCTLVHGASAVYKQVEGNKLTNFGMLPGGTVYKIKSPYFSAMAGYVQAVPGYLEPKIYFSDEISYSTYLPVSSRNYGMIPLEALIKKVTESLLFDDKMASEADGTVPPRKMIIVTDNNPFGAMDDTEKMDIPLDVDEQKRLEQKMKEPIKHGVVTFSGNNIEVVDLSRADTMTAQMQRQKDIREEVALVFNATNMEVNLTGSEDTSGRSTSQAQLEIEQGKGIAPLAKMFQTMINKTLLPMRYGSGLLFEFELGKNEVEEKQLDKLMLETGEMTKNEIREKYGKPTFGEEYDKPEGQSSPDGSEMNPFNMQGM